MDSLSLVFKIHHPFYLRTYRFFDIGERHNYYDDYRNKYILKRFSERSYYQANALMMRLFERYGEKFKVSFVFSGNAIDQMQWYMPELLEDFKRVVACPNVELVATDYSVSASSVMDKEVWKRQVESHNRRLQEVFGRQAKVLAGTQLLYDDGIGKAAAEMGMTGMLTEGAKPVLGWKSPHVVYKHPTENLKLILRDGVLSEDISLRFSRKDCGVWPVMADSFVARMQVGNADLQGGSHVTLYVNYAVMGEFQEKESGIFDFFEALPDKVLNGSGFCFAHLEELCALPGESPALHVPFTISDVDEERDLTAFYANDLQKDVMENWRRVCPAMLHCSDPELQKDFRFLTGVENLGFMSTKYFTETPSIRYLNPYDSPYDAYINYMNVWSDFVGRMKIGGWVDEDGKPVEKDILSDFVPDSVRKAVDAAAYAASDVVDSAADALAGAMDSVGKAVKGMFSRMKKNRKAKVEERDAGAVQDKAGAVKDFVAETAEKAGQAAKKTVRKVKDLGQKALDPDVDKIAEKAADAMDSAEKAVRRAVRKGAEAVLKAVEDPQEKTPRQKTAAKRPGTRKKAAIAVSDVKSASQEFDNPAKDSVPASAAKKRAARGKVAEKAASEDAKPVSAVSKPASPKSAKTDTKPASSAKTVKKSASNALTTSAASESKTGRSRKKV